mgnify:FL=1
MQTQYLEYQDGDTQLEAYVAFEETDQQKPLVLIVHDWTGRRELACQAAEEIARRGYIGFALDVYGKGVFGKDGDAEGNSALMGPYAADRALLRKRMKAALVAARNVPQADASRVAAMGFCFGGMCVLELARSGADVLGVVSIHGLLFPGEVANGEIVAKVLCLHGHDDPLVPPEQVLDFEKEMSAAEADWQIHTYGGTVHAFTNPKANDANFGAVYKESSAKRAYQSLYNFLEELF